MLIKLSLIILPLFLINSTYSAPIDWKGTLAFDSNVIKDVRRTGDDCTAAAGSQCINPEEDNARFQTMILKLNPNLVINDAVTVKGELSTGSGRTSRMGSATQVDSDSSGAALPGTSPFTQTTSSTLQVNQLYAELYADTALYRVGRFSKHFGLGAVINSGNNTWDRFYTGYEGIEAQLKLGKLHLTPMWAKLHTNNSPNGKYDSYESSISMLYDNPNKNVKFGIYYSLREMTSNDTLYGTGAQSTNLIDVFVSKEWEKFSIGFEAPMLSGEINDFYNTTSADYDTNAFILETKYALNTKWDVGVNAGQIKGDDGTSKNFEAMYLHPNYKHSYLMFGYNYQALMDSLQNSGDMFNASMVNATYANLYAHYNSDEWTWRFSALWAKANEVAKAGEQFFDHDYRELVVANADQSDDMGYELSVAFDYRWNPNVTFEAHLAYHFVGDFYAFDNNASNELNTSNVMGTGMSLAINF